VKMAQRIERAPNANTHGERIFVQAGLFQSAIQTNNQLTDA